MTVLDFLHDFHAPIVKLSNSTIILRHSIVLCLLDAFSQSLAIVLDIFADSVDCLFVDEYLSLKKAYLLRVVI